MRYLIGIDDTDNKESRGTGYHSRILGKELNENGIADVLGITRHQLYVHDDIPYTSQNSSACLDVRTNTPKKLFDFCKQHLTDNCVPGSDIGLCIAPFDNIPDEVCQFGGKAKNTVLIQEMAKELAQKHSIKLEGLSGTNDGIIGALSAIGLRKHGNDGRFIWLKGKDLREVNGIYTVDELLELIDSDLVKDINENEIEGNIKVNTGAWCRPVLIDHKKVIIVEHSKSENYEYTSASKDYIRRISN